ncbi:MAG: DNA mismatch repair protein MutL, partial [Clostridia bacterium]|nr:DNA mismatch repair protein MutL [Clostridia bacterium]
SQMLLSPMILKLDFNEAQTVLSNLDAYRSFGFDIEDFGSGSIIVNATPYIGSEAEIRDLVLEIAEAMGEMSRYSIADFEERLLDMIACKYAIKANRRLNAAEMQEVFDTVMRLEADGIKTCPHGRPIKIEFTKTEIEKLFKRRL